MGKRYTHTHINPERKNSTAPLKPSYCCLLITFDARIFWEQSFRIHVKCITPMWTGENSMPQCGPSEEQTEHEKKKKFCRFPLKIFPVVCRVPLSNFLHSTDATREQKKRELSRVRVIATYLFSCRIINRFICTISVSQERKNGVQIGKPRRKRIKSRVKNTAHTWSRELWVSKRALVTMCWHNGRML